MGWCREDGLKVALAWQEQCQCEQERLCKARLLLATMQENVLLGLTKGLNRACRDCQHTLILTVLCLVFVSEKQVKQHNSSVCMIVFPSLSHSLFSVADVGNNRDIPDCSYLMPVLG